MKKNQIELPQGVADLDIQKWKERFGKIKLISCTRENGEEEQYIVAQPTRDIVDAWMSHHEAGRYDKAREVLSKNCVLHGNTDLFKSDINLESTVLKKVQEMLETLRASEKEL